MKWPIIIARLWSNLCSIWQVSLHYRKFQYTNSSSNKSWMQNIYVRLNVYSFILMYTKQKSWRTMTNSTKMIYSVTSQVSYIEKYRMDVLGTHIPIGRYCWRLVRLVCTVGHIHCYLCQTVNQVIKMQINIWHHISTPCLIETFKRIFFIKVLLYIINKVSHIDIFYYK